MKGIKLNSKEAIENIIGKNTAMRFVSFDENMITFVTLIPKVIQSTHYYFTIDLIWNPSRAFLAYESCQDLLFEFEPYQVIAKSISGENIYQIYLKP